MARLYHNHPNNMYHLQGARSMKTTLVKHERIPCTHPLSLLQLGSSQDRSTQGFISTTPTQSLQDTHTNPTLTIQN
ncbi:hypothetical protein G9A89_000333 [Geosiphon pyriformis]|nr:hypothetical protein G9A89_000333 [Geosiphon pyriformis]